MPGNIKKHIPHNWNVICDVCGRQRKKYQTTTAYGSGDIPVVLSCLDGCADVRHPLNTPPPVIFDGRPVPDSRPDVTLTYSYIPSGILIGNFYSQRIGFFTNSYKPIGKMQGP